MIEAIAYFIGSTIGAVMLLTPTMIAWLRIHAHRKTIATINILGVGFIPALLLLPFMIVWGGGKENSDVYLGWFLLLAVCVWLGDIIWASLGRKADLLMSGRRKLLTLVAITVSLVGIMNIPGIISGSGPNFHNINKKSASQPLPTPKKAADIDSGPYAATPWKHVGDWIIRFDQSEANSSGEMNGCFMFRTFGDAALRIGFYAPANDYFIAFTNETLAASLERGKSYDMRVRFGNQSPWDIETTALLFPDGPKVLAFRINANTQFFNELTREPTLDISQGDNRLLHFNLTGSREAFQEMLSCQESHNKKPARL